jgi:hypothetical protein
MVNALTTFLADVTSIISTITSTLTIMTTPPVSYFVALAFAGAAAGIARKFVPTKRK